MNKLIRECCYCVKEMGIKANPNASHGLCYRHALIQLGEIIGHTQALDRLKDRPAKSFCPDLRRDLPSA